MEKLRPVESVLETSWDKMYSLCEKFQEEAGEIGLGDIADTHEELLKESLLQRDQEWLKRIEEGEKELAKLFRDVECGHDSFLDGISVGCPEEFHSDALTKALVILNHLKNK